MRNETKIGILAIIALSILIWGYKFLKGQNILSASTSIYAEYEHVQQLQNSAGIFINGFQVGVVKDIYLKPDDMKTIVVSMSIDRGVKIPKNAYATIISTSVMGGKAIRLDFDGPCSGDNCADNGDYLNGRIQGFLASVVGEPEELDVYVDKVTKGLSTALDTLSAEISDPNSDSAIAKSAQDIQAILANLNATTSKLNHFLSNSTAKMNSVLKNLESISANIAAGNNDIKTTMGNMATFSDQLKTMDLNATLSKTNKVMDNSAASIEKLSGTLQSADKAVAELSGIMTKMKAGEGTLGQLLVDEDLYTNLEKSTRQLELLLQDFRLNPKRYTRILSKKQIEYKKPQVDPANEKGTQQEIPDNTGGH